MIDQVFYAALLILLIVWATISLLRWRWQRNHIVALRAQLEEELATRRSARSEEDSPDA